MTKEEIWAVPIHRIAGYFSEQPEMAADGTVFRCGNCTVSLSRCPERLLAGMPLPQTRVRFDGPAEEAEPIYYRFFMHFISAGG